MPNPDLEPRNKIMSVYNRLRQLAGNPELDLEEYNFSVPQPYSGPRSPANTVIVLTPIPSSGIYGSITLYYDRIDLSTLTGFSVARGSATTVLGLLEELNEELGVALTPIDVEEAALPVGSSFTLTASSQNLIFIGSTQIGLT
jgi:hypothetical protein